MGKTITKLIISLLILILFIINIEKAHFFLKNNCFATNSLA